MSSPGPRQWRNQAMNVRSRIEESFADGREIVRGALGRDDSVEANQLLLAAKHACLLEDFGRGEFREGMDNLIDSLNQADLSGSEMQAARDAIGGRLMNRLQIRDWVKKNPAVVDEVIAAPIVVTGTDPVGVGLLGQALAVDVMNRAPRRWEAAHTVPPAGITTHAHDDRIANFAGDRPGAPASCAELLATGFGDPFSGHGPLPSYWEWWASADHRAAYRHHRLQLQILQSAMPTAQWVLHSTAHLWHLDALLHTYPDARVVWVHRDPAHVVQRLIEREAGAPADFGAVADHLAYQLDAATQIRKTHTEAGFFDLQYVEVIDDTVGAIEWFYRHWGMTLSDLSRWRIQAMLETPGIMPPPVDLPPNARDLVPESLRAYAETYEVPTEATTL